MSGVTMAVGSDCGVSVGGVDVAAGWLQVMGRDGGGEALGVPAGVALEIAQPGAKARGACSAARVPGVVLDAGQATGGFTGPCEGCGACLRKVLKFACGSAAPLRVRVRADVPSRAYLPGPWSGDFEVTPQCSPGAAACFGGQ
jgi:hypothetical protein